MNPTPEELSQSTPGRIITAGTPVTWTYQVFNTGEAAVKLDSIRDDAGTPSNPADDFTPAPRFKTGTFINIGDADNDGLLDPSEVFLFTSAGVSTVNLTDWHTAFQTFISSTDTTGANLTPGWVQDPVTTPNTFSDMIFTGGGSKDVLGISQWQWKMQMPQDKDDIEHSFAGTMVASDTGKSFLVAGLDRYAANGDATIGFWFFQSQISINANGTFNGRHTDGDILLVVDFTVGGSTPVVKLFRWTGNDATGTIVPLAYPAGAAFAIVPTGPTAVPWTFIDKDGLTMPQTGEYLQAGVDLSAIFGANVPTFVSFLSETRSSASTNSTLSDFALGSMNNIGKRYVVKSGPYSNTVTVTGKSQVSNVLVSASNTNYHFGVDNTPTPVTAPMAASASIFATAPLHSTTTKEPAKREDSLFSTTRVKPATTPIVAKRRPVTKPIQRKG
jgi:hypothetical protein